MFLVLRSVVMLKMYLVLCAKPTTRYIYTITNDGRIQRSFIRNRNCFLFPCRTLTSICIPRYHRYIIQFLFAFIILIISSQKLYEFQMYILDIERSNGLHFIRNINHDIPVKCIAFDNKQKVNMISLLYLELFLCFSK